MATNHSATMTQHKQTQEMLDFFNGAFNAQEEVDYSSGLVDAVIANVCTYYDRATTEDLHSYLAGLATKYANRPWIINEALLVLEELDPKQKEWFQKLLLLQP